MGTISRLLLVFLINALWQAPIIVLVAWLCDRLMWNAAARFRHWLWVIALTVCLALPLSGLTGFGRLPAPRLSSAEITQEEKKSAEHLTSANVLNDIWRLNFLGMQPAPITPAPVLMFAIVSCYLMSLFWRLIRFWRAWRRTNEICGEAHARDIPAPMAQAAARCRAAFDPGRISIFSSRSVPAPLTLGVFRPIIILPESLFDSASTETLISALGHEMAHIRRRDFALNLIYELLCLPLAFHPALALVKRRINQTRELACDEMVTDHLMCASAYARSLVDLAGLATNFSRPIHSYNQPLGALDADILEERVMRLIEEKPRLSAKRAAGLLIAASLALALSGVVASAFSLSLGQDKDAKPDFTGKWKAESLKKEVGEPPIPPGAEKEKIEVDHKDPELKIIKSFEELNLMAEVRFTIDGKERTIIAFSNDQHRAKATWSGKQLVMSVWIENSEVAAWLTETWDMDDDRKTLIITKDFMDKRWKMVFKRQ